MSNHRVRLFFCLIIDLISDLIGLLSLTFYMPIWGYLVRAYFIKKDLREKIHEDNC